MARSGVPLAALSPHLQRKVRAKIDESKLGPNSPLLEPTRGRRRRDPGREHAEQVKVIEWADDPKTLARFPELDALYSIPNESFGLKDGAEKKARGRRKGMLDLCLPTPRRAPDGSVYGACYIEMKELAGSVRESQQERIKILRARGNFVDVAMSAEAAIAFLSYYLSLRAP
jgi:hypothetical protein